MNYVEVKIRFSQAAKARTVKQQSKRGRKKINLVLFRYIKLKAKDVLHHQHCLILFQHVNENLMRASF
jgi:tryptophanyl-tRNA synthetase